MILGLLLTIVCSTALGSPAQIHSPDKISSETCNESTSTISRILQYEPTASVDNDCVETTTSSTSFKPQITSTSIAHSVSTKTRTRTKTTTQPTATSLSDFFYALEYVHSRYAFAPYCTSISDLYKWNCGEICSHEANTTILDFVHVDPVQDQVVHLTFNPNLHTIYVAFRGSETLVNLGTDLNMKLSNCDWNNNEIALKPRNIPFSAKIHSGFEIAYSAMRVQVLSQIHQLSLRFPKYSIVFTGHSLGGALALISAVDYFDKYGMQDRITVVSYGQPRTGDKTWCNYVESLPFSARYYRVVKVGDPIPLMPSTLLGYSDCGNLVEYEDNIQPRICVEGTVEGCRTEYGTGRPKDHSWYQNWVGHCE